MTTKPEALRLEDALLETDPYPLDIKQAAAELRRLRAEKGALLQALKLMRERFLDVDGDHGRWEREATDAADAAIALVEGK